MKIQLIKTAFITFLKAQKRSSLLIGSLLFLIIGSLGGLKLYSLHLMTSAIETPIPPLPDIQEVVDRDSVLKTKIYDEELRREVRGVLEDTEDQERWGRISMSWDKVYQEIQADSLGSQPMAQPVAKPQLERPKPPPRRRRTSRSRRPKKKVAQKPKTQVVPPKPGFNLITQEAEDEGKQEQGTPTPLQFAKAVIAGEVKLRAGETVRLQLLEPISVQGVKIPELTLVSGRISFGSNRVYISVEHVNVGGNVLAVNWQCYDQHLSKGLPHEGGGQGVEAPVNNRLLRRADRDIGRGLPQIPYVSDAAEGVIDATKGLLRKKRVKGSLPNNYTVYLKIMK